MARDEPLRLFLALRLPADVLAALEDWQRRELRGAPRLVPREHLHVTLVFLGSRPREKLPAIVEALRAAASSAAEIRLALGGYRETRSVGMLVLDDLEGAATALAGDLHERLERLGVYERETRPWFPHVTVARWRERPRLRPEPPSRRTFVPSDAAAYLSRLRPGGAEYRVLESVALGARVGGE